MLGEEILTTSPTGISAPVATLPSLLLTGNVAGHLDAQTDQHRVKRAGGRVVVRHWPMPRLPQLLRPVDAKLVPARHLRLPGADLLPILKIESKSLPRLPILSNSSNPPAEALLSP